MSRNPLDNDIPDHNVPILLPQSMNSIPNSIANKKAHNLVKPLQEKIYSTAEWICNHVPEEVKMAVNKNTV
jgi:hypothetical protein